MRIGFTIFLFGVDNPVTVGITRCFGDSAVEALPHERQGLLAAHGAALEETLIVSRRPP